MKCPVCGGAELEHGTRDMPYTYKGQTTVIASVTGDYCPACGESTHDMKESARVMDAMNEFMKEVNAGFVEPTFIKKVRRKLRLGQKDASALFGGGANAFSRYETGKTKPPLSLIRLFKVLDRHPELIDEIKADR
jgi:HTH-type transcriptional regulator/antitoxin MqsA